MTTPVCVRRRIRQLDRQGLSHKEISRRLGVSRTTVVKYANHGDYSPRPSNAVRPGRSLVDDGYAAIVDGWPAADLRMSVKQRHTATRVYERLVAECGFTGPYSSVQRRVKRWRQEHRARSDGFAESKWAPGSAQVDFGQARAVVAGVERVVRFLAVSFPCSNMRRVAALPGETAECVCQGLLEVFERTGMTPGVVVFDNATGVGHRNSDGTAARTRLFSLFRAHYGFEPRFCNPYSGHEKGSVENAVGFRGARPDGADAVGRELPGVGPRVARRHPRRGRRMRVRGHRQSGGDRHRRRTDHRPGRNRHMRPTRPRGQGLLGRPGSETP